MSQFSTMTTRERKMQAAAICREFQAQEDIEMDLGKKMSVPKDIMLEELSLASNQGARLFKMRQRRSEKYTFENIQNENNKLLNLLLVMDMKIQPEEEEEEEEEEAVSQLVAGQSQETQCSGGRALAQKQSTCSEAGRSEENTAVSQTENGNPTVSHSGENNSGDNQPSKVPPDTAHTGIVPNPDSIAPGYGGPLKDIPPEKFNSTAVPKSYFSPWEQAIISDPTLAGTCTTCIPEPVPQAHLPGYKSFNRVAIPFGGFSKAPRPAPIRSPQVEALPDFPDLRVETKVTRPTFNRSAVGWLSASGSVPFPTVSLEPVPLPESEDL